MKELLDLWERLTPFVSLRRRELKWSWRILGNGVSCSSPCGDVSWNFYLPEVAMEFYVRLLAGMWVVILKMRLKNTWKKVFVPSRRRELKWYTRTNTLAILSSSPRGDVSWNIFSGANYLGDFCSDPCGDVSWNTIWLRGHGNSNSSSPYGDASWNDDIKWNTTDEYRFVSSRRRELK